MSKPLTWEEIANEYDKRHNRTARPARTLPLNYVFEWLRNHPDFVVKDGMIYKEKDNGKSL